MSEVISFRLNKDDLREANALLVLQEWRTRGYSIRQTIAEALNKLDQNGVEPDSTAVEPDSTALDELNETLCQVNNLLRQIELGNSLPVGKIETTIQKAICRLVLSHR